MAAYYNEFDPFAAAWLRELMKDGLIPDGVVDERSILEVQADDIREFTQCHFFAGIGGWSYALQLAGWPTTRPVWTGSPPCQPFSTAGKRRGSEDERHLWPAFFNLIRQCRPATVFGEQVAAAIRDSWFDALRTDMEAEGYATGMVVLPACSVGAPHKRDRLWFVANANVSGQQGQGELGRPSDTEKTENREVDRTVDASWERSIVANAISAQEHQEQQRPAAIEGGWSADEPSRRSVVDSRCVGYANNDGCETGCEASASTGHRRADDATGWADSTVGDSEHDGSHDSTITRGITEAGDNSEKGSYIPSKPTGTGRPCESGDICHWADSTFIYCRDGKHRPIPLERSLFPLADGIPNRVGILRGAGNAIVPALAAEVIKAFMGYANESV